MLEAVQECGFVVPSPHFSLMTLLFLAVQLQDAFDISPSKRGCQHFRFHLFILSLDFRNLIKTWH
ncbi:MAG: hypothetical protein IPK63_18390 [Candidatus Competibacteraceae bacterium]|nr:hypothetical protein [Candidatus Competibacteraceae bacterium]